jgi:hypothetical protein
MAPVDNWGAVAMGRSSLVVYSSVILLAACLAACDPFDDAPLAERLTPRPPPTQRAGLVTPGERTPTGLASPAPSIPPPLSQRPAATPTLPPATVTPTATVTPSPAATPTAAGTPATPRAAASGYRREQSNLYPYAIDIANDWLSQAGGANFEVGRADLFVGERQGRRSNSVTVLSQVVPAETTSQLFIEASLAELTAAGITITRQQERGIDGVPAVVYSYATSVDGQTYTISQAVFVRRNFGWIITLTAIPEHYDRLQHVFNHMLDSFEAWG